MDRPVRDGINAAPLCFQKYDDETAGKEKLSKAASKTLGTTTAVVPTMLVDLLTFSSFVIGRSDFPVGSCLEEVCSKMYRWLQRERESSSSSEWLIKS